MINNYTFIGRGNFLRINNFLFFSLNDKKLLNRFYLLIILIGIRRCFNLEIVMIEFGLDQTYVCSSQKFQKRDSLIYIVIFLL